MGELVAIIGPFLCFVGIGAIVILASAVRIIKEYERGVIFRLGRVIETKGPGLILLIPIIDKMSKVDLRTITLDVPSQEAITSDNVTVKVNAVVYFQVIDPIKSVIQVQDFRRATWQIAQTSLRNVIGQSTLDHLLQERERVNDTLQEIIDVATEPWGVKVSIVEVKDVELNSTMIRAMAREAEAERERRAKIIHADGELEASEALAKAAAQISKDSGAMTLRYLQTLVEIGVEQNSTIIFPVPVDLITPFVKEGRLPFVSQDQTPQTAAPSENDADADASE